MVGFDATVDLLVVTSPVFEAAEIQDVLPSVFALAYFLQDEDEEVQKGSTAVSQATQVWRAWVGRAPVEVFSSVKTMAKKMLVDVSAHPR